MPQLGPVLFKMMSVSTISSVAVQALTKIEEMARRFGGKDSR